MDLEGAVDKATEFLENLGHHRVHHVTNANLEEGTWKVKADVGPIQKMILEVQIDDGTGKVMQCEPIMEPDKSCFRTFYLIDMKKEDGKLFWRWTGRPNGKQDEWKEVTDIHSLLTTYYPPDWCLFIRETMEL